jgi:hypothetical protein
MHDMETRLDRRRVLKTLALGLSLPALGSLSAGELFALRRFREAATQEGSSASTGFTTLSADQGRLVAEIAERILPRTDTPGAKDAEVHLFVDQMLSHWFPPAERTRFLEDLDRLEETSRGRFQRSFVELEDGERDLLLTELEEEAIQQRGGTPWALQPASVEPSQLVGAHFFDLAKWLTVIGYYTSEVGMKQELGFRMIPGRYEGCREEGA